MPWAAAAPAQYLDEVRPRYGVCGTSALWLTEHGERISARSVDDRFALAWVAAGLPAELSVHCLRRLYAQRQDDAGVPVDVLRELIAPSRPTSKPAAAAAGQPTTTATPPRFSPAATLP